MSKSIALDKLMAASATKRSGWRLDFHTLQLTIKFRLGASDGGRWRSVTALRAYNVRPSTPTDRTTVRGNQTRDVRLKNLIAA